MTARDPGEQSGRRLTLKDMIQGAGTTARAVRFYETEKLITPAARSRGGHRLFDEAELSKLRLIIDLRTCGFSLEEIREILRAKSGTEPVRESALKMKALLGAHLAVLRHKVAVIERLSRELSTSAELLDHCVHCTDPRGPDACMSCDVPVAVTTPPCFRHLWPIQSQAPLGAPNPPGARGRSRSD